MGFYVVGPDGKAQKGLNVGDKVGTAVGIYTIESVNDDGSYVTGEPVSGGVMKKSSSSGDSIKDLENLYKSNTEARKSYAAEQTARTNSILEQGKKNTEQLSDSAARMLYNNLLMSSNKGETESSQLIGASAAGRGQLDLTEDKNKAVSEMSLMQEKNRLEGEANSKLMDADNLSMMVQLEKYREDKQKRDKQEAKEYAFSMLEKGICSDEIAEAAGLELSVAAEYADKVSRGSSVRRQELVELILETGYEPSAAEIEAAGMTEAQVKAWQEVRKKEQAEKKKAEQEKKSSSSGASSYGGSSSKDKLNYGEMHYIIGESDDPMTVFYRCVEAGWVTSSSNYKELYQFALKLTIEKPPIDYESACRVLRICNVANTEIMKLFTRDEWYRRKEGSGGKAAFKYHTYEQYVADYVRKLITPKK